MNWIKLLLAKWLAKPLKYPEQILNEKQSAIIDGLDRHLSESCGAAISDTAMVIKTTKIPLFSQHYNVTKIVDHLRSSIVTDSFGYIPRSVALLVESDGTWSLYYAVRVAGVATDEVTAGLFIDALGRTNNARS